MKNSNEIGSDKLNKFKRKYPADGLKCTSISIPSTSKNSLDYEMLLVFFVPWVKRGREVTNATKKVYVKKTSVRIKSKTFE